MSPNSQSSYDDDIDDIMASIMQSNSPKTEKPIAAAPTRPRVNPLPSSRAAPKTARAASPPRRANPAPQNNAKRKFPTKLALSATTFIVVVTGGFFIWNGPISALLTPSSPFSPEVSSGMKTPLYYPTKLPGSYKIELGSVAQPESTVVVYAASDDSNNKINFSMQKKPKGLNLDPLYEVLEDKRKVETKFGTISYGTSEDNIDIINVIAENTWIIITTDKGLLQPEDIQTIVNSFKS